MRPARLGRSRLRSVRGTTGTPESASTSKRQRRGRWRRGERKPKQPKPRAAREAGGADGARSRSGGLLITAADVTQGPGPDAADDRRAVRRPRCGTDPGRRLPRPPTWPPAPRRDAPPRSALSDRAPLHHSRFAYDPGARYRCPEGRLLSFQRLKHRRRRASVRVYAAAAADCLACPAFGRCTTSTQGRRIEVSLHADALTAHRRWMQTAAARESATADRAGLRDHQGAAGRPPLLLRGLEAPASGPCWRSVQPAHARQAEVDQPRSLLANRRPPDHRPPPDHRRQRHPRTPEHQPPTRRATPNPAAQPLPRY